MDFRWTKEVRNQREKWNEDTLKKAKAPQSRREFESSIGEGIIHACVFRPGRWPDLSSSAARPFRAWSDRLDHALGSFTADQ